MKGLLLNHISQSVSKTSKQKHIRSTVHQHYIESRNQLNAILNNVADGITAQDPTGKLIFVNPVAAKDMGYSTSQQALRAPYLDYLHRFDMYDEAGKKLRPEDLPGRRAIQGEKNPELTLLSINKKTKEKKWMTVRSSAVHGKNKRPLFIINVMTDITQVKELEQRKNDFISMASHELKTPLTSVRLYNQMLIKRFGDENDFLSYQLLSKMDKQLVKLSDLVKELLDVTNINRGKLSLKKDYFYVKELVLEIVESLQPLTTHRLQIEWKTQELVYADKERIRQVLTNFVTNAVKFSPEKAPIILGSEKKGKEIIVRVQDKGSGIPKNQQKKIFDRFYQANPVHSTYPGLGLGLYISSQIVRLHSGRIWVKSQVGKGSTFYFSLPLPR